MLKNSVGSRARIKAQMRARLTAALTLHTPVLMLVAVCTLLAVGSQPALAVDSLHRFTPEGATAIYYAADGALVRAITWIPAGKGPHPVIVALHSESGAQSDALAAFRKYGAAFAPLGYAIVAPDTRGGALGGAELDDVLVTLDYIADHERLDRDRVVIVGASHAAYLAALTACRERVLGIVLIGGFYDLAAYAAGELDDTRSPQLAAIRDATIAEIGAFAPDSGVYAARSPLYNVDSISAAVLMFHSRNDRVISAEYSQRFAEALERSDVLVDYYVLGGDTHIVDITSDETADELALFLESLGLPVAPPPE
jgi:dipeptidyl aminopeptidase/acylaminoacyl peptidase